MNTQMQTAQTLPAPPMPDSAPVAWVAVKRLTGTPAECERAYTFDGPQAVSNAECSLRGMADTAPKELGTHKVQVVIAWDGFDEGPLVLQVDLRYEHRRDYDLLAEVRRVVFCYAGMVRPARMAEEAYQAMLRGMNAGQKLVFMQIAETCDLG